MRTSVYRLRPTTTREAALTTTLDTCRHRYNRAWADRQDAWGHEHRPVTFAAQCATLPAQKREDPYPPAVRSQVLHNPLRRLDRAFDNFCRRVKSGDGKAGYPRFRGRGWYDACCYPQWGNGAKFADGELALSQIGAVRICADRPRAGAPKTCAIVREADGWYAHITGGTADEALPATGASAGVAVGLTHLATLATGEKIANPRHHRAAERRLRKAQRRVSRRVQGSGRRAKARTLLAKAHLQVQRQRHDVHHKAALPLVRRFACIAVEDLHMRGMLRNHALANTPPHDLLYTYCS